MNYYFLYIFVGKDRCDVFPISCDRKEKGAVGVSRTVTVHSRAPRV